MLKTILACLELEGGNMTPLYFTISELCESYIARENKINNSPTNLIQLDNMLRLIHYVLNPLRSKLGKPITVTSGFRCKQLNAHPQVKGAVNSQHLTGEAADIYVKGCSARTLFEYIRNSDIEYDQLINEYDRWVHISYRHGNNRRQAFKIT